MDELQSLVSAAKVAAAAWASKDLAGKLLGPTFDYVGGEMRHFAEKCNINLTNIFVRAQQKLGAKIDEPGQVSPRVLKNVLDDGSFCEDTLCTEYFAGVLAAARGEGGSDDRAVSYLALLRDLSTYQIYAHYLVYWSLKQLLHGRRLRLSIAVEATRMRIFLPFKFLEQNFTIEKNTDGYLIFNHAFQGLGRQGLIRDNWQGVTAEFMHDHDDRLQEAGYLVTPTAMGGELFMWAHGVSDVHVGYFLESDVVFTDPADYQVHLDSAPIHLPDMSRPVSE
jgi:hypothetical protein